MIAIQYVCGRPKNSFVSRYPPSNVKVVGHAVDLVALDRIICPALIAKPS